jgi:hypothetical protein
VFRLVDIFLLDAHTGVPRGNLSVHNIQVIEGLHHRVVVVVVMVVVVMVPARDSIMASAMPEGDSGTGGIGTEHPGFIGCGGADRS